MNRDDFERAAAATTRKVNNTTWHDVSLGVARLVLLAFGSLWFRTFLGWIRPQFVLTLDFAVMLNNALDLFLALSLAAACTTVPSIFLAGLIPNSPANNLLAGLDYKYGRPGYWFAAIGAFIFSLLGLAVLWDYWIQRPGFIIEPGVTPPVMLAVMPGLLTLVSLILMIGFPAWALNRMTPEQWVDAIRQARHVARLKRIMDLEDAAEKAIIVRARTLLLMDVTKMTMEQRAANNREVAAILAAANRGFAESLRQVNGTFKSLYKMDVVTAIEKDEDIDRRYRGLLETFDMTTDEAEHYVDRGDAFAAAVEVVHEDTGDCDALTTALSTTVRSRSPVVHHRAETVERAVNRDRDREDRHGTATVPDHGRPRTAAADEQQLLFVDAFQIMWRKYSYGAWTRKDLEDAFDCGRTKALDIIKAWCSAGLIEDVRGQRHHYMFVDSQAWPATWLEEVQ